MLASATTAHPAVRRSVEPMSRPRSRYGVFREGHLAIGNSAKPLLEIERDDVVVRTATRVFGANVLNNDLLTVVRPD
jgi:hypothetical protein